MWHYPGKRTFLAVWFFVKWWVRSRRVWHNPGKLVLVAVALLFAKEFSELQYYRWIFGATFLLAMGRAFWVLMQAEDEWWREQP